LKWEKEQALIRGKIVEKNEFTWTPFDMDLVAGVDISASKKDTDVACATLIIYSRHLGKALHEESQIFNISGQPYVPGFLAFREVPVLLVLFNRLK
jgi:deoxyinosine 3'endonuclease (endonuclease V)